MWSKKTPLLVAGLADDHRALQLGVVAPHRRARPGDQHVPWLEDDVVGQGMGDRCVAPDLAAVAGPCPAGEIALGPVDRADGVQHGQGGFQAGAPADLGLGEPRPGCTAAAAHAPGAPI